MLVNQPTYLEHKFHQHLFTVIESGHRDKTGINDGDDLLDDDVCILTIDSTELLMQA